MPGWLESMLPFRRCTLEVDSYFFHVMESGPEDGPVVYLQHGNPTWGFLYRDVAKALEGSGLRVIMPDLLGLGFSEKPRDESLHTLVNHSNWMAGVLDALGVEELIMGVQDWGGPIGTLAAGAKPGRIKGAVVMNTGLTPPKPGFKPTAFHKLSQTPVISDLIFKGLAFPQCSLSMAQGDFGSIMGDVHRAYTWPLKRSADRVAPLALARMVPNTMDHPSIAPMARCEEIIRSFEGPAEIVWGKRDPILGRLLKRTRGLFPQAPATVTGAGHFLQEEVPDEIAAAILRVAKQLNWSK